MKNLKSLFASHFALSSISMIGSMIGLSLAAPAYAAVDMGLKDMPVFSAEQGLRQGRFDLKVLAGNYVATDCSDTIQQADTRDNPNYDNARLEVTVKNGKLKLTHKGIHERDYLNLVSESLDADFPGGDLTESYASGYGVYKVKRAADLPGFRNEWEIMSEGYNTTGLQLTARHLEFVDGALVEKSLRCHYTKI